MDRVCVSELVPGEWLNISHSLYAKNFTSNTFLLNYETHQELLHTYKLDVLKKLFPEEDQLKNYLQAHITFFKHISTSLPIPKIIYDHGVCLNFKDSIAYYRTEYPAGTTKSLCGLDKIHRAEIALLLSKIHQVDYQAYVSSLFSHKNKLLVQAWGQLEQINGLKLIGKLANERLGLNLDALLQLLYKHKDDLKSGAFGKNIVFAHADVKPKNIFWENNLISALLHWDDMCCITAGADFLETLINWTIVKSQDTYFLNLQQAHEFRKAYALPLSIQSSDFAMVIARWCFYTLFCYQHQDDSGYNEGLRMLAFLDREQKTLLHFI